MLALKIIGYILLTMFIILVVSFAIMGAFIVYEMTISVDNCTGCMGYPKVCKKCTVYKHMTDEEKAVWLMEE